jgi:hypothetical protein
VYGLRLLSIANDYNGFISDFSEIYRFNKRWETEENGFHKRGSISMNFKLGYKF